MDSGTTMVPVGRHRLEATALGTGTPTVVIEPSYGGWAKDWRQIAEAVAAQTTVVTYDRAPYGNSSAARDGRTAAEIAADLHGLLDGLGVTGPLVLVGHSMGGVYVRAYAARHLDRVAGMVLVDSSHEGQWPVLDEIFPPKYKLLGALMVPRILFSTRAWRQHGDRLSMLREYRAFKRLSHADSSLAPGQLGDRPLAVLTRAPTADAKRLWEGCCALQRDLALLSANSRHVISDSPDHYLNAGDPELVIATITDVLRSARTGAPLGCLPGEESAGAAAAGLDGAGGRGES